jgi:hypothetical protein
MKWVAAAAATSTVAPPAMVFVAVSVAVSVWLPAVFKVALKLPTPALRVVFIGTKAVASVVLKWTVPVYAVAVLPNESRAVTVKAPLFPATLEGRAMTAKWVAASGLTWMAAVPATEAIKASLMVSVSLPAVCSVAVKVPTPLLRAMSAGSVAPPSLLVK